MKRMNLLLMMALSCSTIFAQNSITFEKVSRKSMPPMPTMTYQPTVGGNASNRYTDCNGNYAVAMLGSVTSYQTGEASLKADFSIQNGTSQVMVWSENFDNDLSQWTVNNEVKEGWGPVTVELASTSGRKVPFTDYDENDVTSLHIEGDYRVSMRNMAYVTSGDVVVPQNAVFHAYVGYDIIGLPYIVKTELKIETVYELT